MDPSTLTPPTNPPILPTDVTPSPPKVKKGGKGTMKKPYRTASVTVPDNTEYQVANLKPHEMTWVIEQCWITEPDPDNPKQDRVRFEARRRPLLMVAIGMREPDGSRSFPGSVENPEQWIYGEKHVAEMDNEDYEPLLAKINELSGYGEKARALVGKGSEKTTSTGS